MSMSTNAPEFRLQIDRNPADPTRAPKLSAAKKANEAIGADVRARRAKIHDQHRQDQAEREAMPEPMPLAPPPQRENIETIEFSTPDGRTIEYGPQRNISVVDRIARLYVGRDPSISEFRLTRILMGVRSIDGRVVAPIGNEIDRTALANRLGDEAIDLLMYFDRVHFPPLQQSELPVIKKNFKT